MNYILSLFIAYFLGSIPSAVWVAKISHGIDIREHGSRNAGLTNVFRVLGWKPALPVVFLDLGKGMLAPWIAQMLVPEHNWFPLMAGVLAIVGHSFTCLAGFRGGKGVLTALGVFLFLAPIPALLAFSLWILLVWITGFVSVGSIFACLSLGVFLTVEFFLGTAHWSLLLCGWTVALFVIYKHKTNIVRLRQGTENRFGKRPQERSKQA